MPSVAAQKVAGTFEPDTVESLPDVRAWLSVQCRTGPLAEAVKRFCAAQDETVNPALVIVETVTEQGLCCTIPCRCSDHESPHTFRTEVKFRVNPRTQTCVRLP